MSAWTVALLIVAILGWEHWAQHRDQWAGVRL